MFEFAEKQIALVVYSYVLDVFLLLLSAYLLPPSCSWRINLKPESLLYSSEIICRLPILPFVEMSHVLHLCITLSVASATRESHRSSQNS